MIFEMFFFQFGGGASFFFGILNWMGELFVVEGDRWDFLNRGGKLFFC